jgi:hypothetical protein
MKWSVTEKGNVIASCLVYVEEQTIFPCVIFLFLFLVMLLYTLPLFHSHYLVVFKTIIGLKSVLNLMGV